MLQAMLMTIKSAILRFTPPQYASLLQWLDGKYTPVGNFDGTNYLTVTKTQTITDEWQCFFEIDFIPSEPNNIERFYQTSTDIRFDVTGGGELSLYNNGVVYDTQGSIDLNSREKINLKVMIKDDSSNIIIDGVDNIRTGLIWTDLESTQYTVSTPSSTRALSAIVFGIADCTESYSIVNGQWIGSLGTIPTVTDPSGTMYDYELGENKVTEIPELYALKETTPTVVPLGEGDYVDPDNPAQDLCHRINLNPNDDARLTDLISPGVGIPNDYLNRAEIDALHDGLIRFLTPIVGNSTLAAELVRSLIYETGTVLSQTEIDKILKYVGRSL